MKPLQAQEVTAALNEVEASLPTPTIKTRSTAPWTLKKAILEPLPTRFDCRGFHYSQIARNGMFAIYSQAWNGIKNPNIAYEVVRIEACPEQIMFGKLVPAHEAFPSPEQWGSQAWTFTSEEKARAKFQDLANPKQPTK
jgi:hypothetical protein